MKVIKYTVYGALVGLCSGLILGYCMGCESAFSCAEEWIYAIFGCNGSSFTGGCQQFTNNPVVKNCIIFSTVICALIGGAYAEFQSFQEKEAIQEAKKSEQQASAKKQREILAREAKQKALDAYNICCSNKEMDKSLVSIIYESDTQLTQIINELTNVAEKQGKVESLTEELSKKGGTSL